MKKQAPGELNGGVPRERAVFSCIRVRVHPHIGCFKEIVVHRCPEISRTYRVDANTVTSPF